MSTIVTRAGKGAPLTHSEVDANFTNLNTDKYQAGDNPSFGNITVTGTVDGRDVSADGTKLDGIEAGATADQTAAEILTAIKTVDGSGSGLDADLLDGQHASAFATAAQGALADTAVQPADLATVATSGSYTDLINTPSPFDPNTLATVATTGSYTDLINIPANIVTDAAYVHTDNNYTITEKNKLAGIEAGATADQTAAEILTAIKTVDGAGSGLDADTLDGNQASAFALASHTHDYVPERNRSDWNDGTVIGDVIGQMAWKNYGNGHTIFDASNSTSPDGTAVNNTDSQVAWSGSYPTLMGWNGANTYGVRVDRARLADNVVNAPAPSTAQVLAAVAATGAGAVGSYALMNYVAAPNSNASYQPGTTFAGSGLRYASNNEAYYSTTTGAGTWRLMGYMQVIWANDSDGTRVKYTTSLFLRIA